MSFVQTLTTSSLAKDDRFFRKRNLGESLVENSGVQRWKSPGHGKRKVDQFLANFLSDQETFMTTDLTSERRPS